MVRRKGIDRRQQQTEVSLERRKGKERRLLDDRRGSIDRRSHVYIDRRAQPIF